MPIVSQPHSTTSVRSASPMLNTAVFCFNLYLLTLCFSSTITTPLMDFVVSLQPAKSDSEKLFRFSRSDSLQISFTSCWMSLRSCAKSRTRGANSRYFRASSLSSSTTQFSPSSQPLSSLHGELTPLASLKLMFSMILSASLWSAPISHPSIVVRIALLGIHSSSTCSGLWILR